MLTSYCDVKPNVGDIGGLDEEKWFEYFDGDMVEADIVTDRV